MEKKEKQTERSEWLHDRSVEFHQSSDPCREREREKQQAEPPLVSFLSSSNLTSVLVHFEGFSTGTI